MDGTNFQHLLSIVATLLTLTLLYIPTSTPSILLASITLFLILTHSNTLHKNSPIPEFKTPHHQIEDFQPKSGAGVGSKSELDHQFVDNSFKEWDVGLGAPLEVIYEEQAELESDVEELETASLSRYFPESDSDTTSFDGEYPDWDVVNTPGKIGSKWEVDDANGLIEIELDDKNVLDIELEDSMFEIDISPASSSQIPTT